MLDLPVDESGRNFRRRYRILRRVLRVGTAIAFVPFALALDVHVAAIEAISDVRPPNSFRFACVLICIEIWLFLSQFHTPLCVWVLGQAWLTFKTVFPFLNFFSTSEVAIPDGFLHLWRTDLIFCVQIHELKW